VDGVTDGQTVTSTRQEGGTCGRCYATPAAVAEAKARQFRHATVAPRGAPPTPDPRLLEWRTPKTNSAPGKVNLAYSTTKQVRNKSDRPTSPTSTQSRAHSARATPTPSPTSPPSRQQRSRLPADLAAATTHWAIPDVERCHLLITVHHGHLQGGDKCKGDRRWCATCLKAGDQHEDTAIHTAHECTVAREVWAKVANAWEDATGERLDVSHPRLTVLGACAPCPRRRSRPPTRPAIKPPNRLGASCTLWPSFTYTRPETGCTWHTTPSTAARRQARHT